MTVRLAARLAVAISTSAALWGCGGDEGCDFDATTRDEGGLGLMDCGLARDGNTGAVDACALRARASRATFRALYEQPDGSLEAIIHSADDEYVILRTPEDASTIERAPCNAVIAAQEGERTYVACSDVGDFVTICE